MSRHREGRAATGRNAETLAPPRKTRPDQFVVSSRPSRVVATPEWFLELLTRYRRVAIAGGPRTGKSTLAALVTDRPVLASDRFRDLPWSDVPAAMIREANGVEGVDGHESFVVEGVQAARALRKGLQVDAVVWLPEAHEQLTSGQAAMAKGTRTVFTEWLAKSGDTPVFGIDGFEAQSAPVTPVAPKSEPKRRAVELKV